MSPEESASIEEQFTARLVGYDAALAAGTTPPVPGNADTPLELDTSLREGLECLQLLERVWPRRREQGERQKEKGKSNEAVESALSPFAVTLSPSESRLGRFRIRRELGRGSYGIVFLAHDPQMRREVALKVPRPEVLVTPEVRQRFLHEAQAAALLDHPNVVPVYDVGEEGPVCFIASAYCPGITLAAWLKERSGLVPARAAATLIATLAEAAHHAHLRGVVHRDLKPGNILLVVSDQPSAVSKDQGGTMRSWGTPCKPPKPGGSKPTRICTAPWSARLGHFVRQRVMVIV